MEPVTRTSFEEWAEKSNWLPVNETPNPLGRQTTFVTPSGSLVFAIYNMQGNLHSIAQPVPQAQPQAMPQGIQLPRLR